MQSNALSTSPHPGALPSCASSLGRLDKSATAELRVRYLRNSLRLRKATRVRLRACSSVSLKANGFSCCFSSSAFMAKSSLTIQQLFVPGKSYAKALFRAALRALFLTPPAPWAPAEGPRRAARASWVELSTWTWRRARCKRCCCTRPSPLGV